MADAVKCCLCEYYKFKDSSCLFYPKKIPKEIFLEDVQCSKFSERKIKVDNDIPYVTRGK